MGLTNDCQQFLKEVCPPKTTALCALGGFLSGRVLGISPVQGMAYAATSRIVFACAFKVNGVISDKFIDIFSRK